MEAAATEARSHLQLKRPRQWSIYLLLHDATTVTVSTGASAVHIRPLQNVLNAAARLVVRKGKYDSIIIDLRDVLHWLPVQHTTHTPV